MKDLKKQEQEAFENKLREACEKKAVADHGEEKLKKWTKEFKGLWFLPISNDDGKIIKLAIMKPITRKTLSYASTKITEEGLYEFLEAGMRGCWVAGDECIIDDDEYFIPAAQTFNKMMEGYKANLLKR